MTGPLLLWLLIQLGALSIAMFRVPLSAAYPQPAEMLAPHVMVVAQLAAAALLFPYLLSSWSIAIAVVATAWPFMVIAGLMSPAPLERVAVAGAYVSCWLIALAALNSTLSSAARPFAVAVANLFTFGGVAVYYLNAEFATDAFGEQFVGTSPPLVALRELSSSGSQPRLWALPLAVAVGSIVARFLLTRRVRISTAPAQFSARPQGPHAATTRAAARSNEEG